MAAPDTATLAAEILRQTAARGPDSSICPSEVARALAPEESWRGLLGPIRQAAMTLAREGRVQVLRKGKPVPLDQPPHGVLRLRQPPAGWDPSQD